MPVSVNGADEIVEMAYAQAHFGLYGTIGTNLGTRTIVYRS
jgi:hypothetical protein